MDCLECKQPVTDGHVCSSCERMLHFGKKCFDIAESTYKRMEDKKSTWRCAQCRNSGSGSQSGIAEVLQKIKAFRADFGTMRSDITALKTNMEACTSAVHDINTK
ncbi:hypothetical protein O0L34_g12953 [Tuta absoluta]|nr:hypothetical protein O0L34_g12953 [Tuta absoluta]